MCSLPAPSARRNAAERVLTLDLTRAQALLLSDFAKRKGLGSFDLRHCSPLRASRMADASYITVTTYLRFEFTRAFVRRPYLIYVDADVLVRGDLTAPLGSLGPDETGAVRDEFNPAVGECPALPGAAERRPHLRGSPYFNAGVLWAHTDHLPRVRRGVEHSLTHARRHILHNDQDALNLWLLRSGRVRPVAGGFNRFEVGRFLGMCVLSATFASVTHSTIREPTAPAHKEHRSAPAGPGVHGGSLPDGASWRSRRGCCMRRGGRHRDRGCSSSCIAGEPPGRRHGCAGL